MAYIIPVFISYAGCPHICAFCNQHKINQQTEFSLLEVNRQINKYLSFLPNDKEKELAFYGGSFTGLPVGLQEELLSLARNLKGKNVIHKVRLSTRPDYIDENVIKRLLKYQVSTVEIGVQSLDEEVLCSAKRGHDAKSVEKAAFLIKDAKIELGLQFMLGLPKQDWLSVKATTQKAVNIKPAIARIYPLLIFADTDLANLYMKNEFFPISLDTAVEQAAYMVEQFEAHGINVIRLGLQDDDGLREQNAILAGPYHPAFGELVASYRCLQVVKQKLDTLKNVKNIQIQVPKNHLSKYIGHKKTNILYLNEHYPFYKITFVATDSKEVKFVLN